MNRAQLLELVSPVPGWLADDEAWALFRLARDCTGRGAIVELGSWRGKSTICLALGSKEGAAIPIVSVDRHMDKTFADFQANLDAAGVTDLVRPIRARSQEAGETFLEAIELLFIDASHEYDDVRRDFDLWVPKVVEEGVVAMHDTTWTGSKRVSEESIYRSAQFRNVRFVPSSTTIAVKAPAGPGDRQRARNALAAKRLAELGHRVRRFVPKRLAELGRRGVAAAGGRG